MEKWVLDKELVEKINLEDIQYGLFTGEANKGHYIFIEEWIELKALGARAFCPNRASVGSTRKEAL